MNYLTSNLPILKFRQKSNLCFHFPCAHPNPKDLKLLTSRQLRSHEGYPIVIHCIFCIHNLASNSLLLLKFCRKYEKNMGFLWTSKMSVVIESKSNPKHTFTNTNQYRMCILLLLVMLCWKSVIFHDTLMKMKLYWLSNAFESRTIYRRKSCSLFCECSNWVGPISALEYNSVALFTNAHKWKDDTICTFS